MDATMARQRIAARLGVMLDIGGVVMISGAERRYGADRHLASIGLAAWVTTPYRTTGPSSGPNWNATDLGEDLAAVPEVAADMWRLLSLPVGDREYDGERRDLTRRVLDRVCEGGRRLDRVAATNGRVEELR